MENEGSSPAPYDLAWEFIDNIVRHVTAASIMGSSPCQITTKKADGYTRPYPVHNASYCLCSLAFAPRANILVGRRLMESPILNILMPTHVTFSGMAKIEYRDAINPA